MEFLMTYGWAILVVLAAIGALAYFGVLSPDRFLPDKCTANPPFACTQYKVTESGAENLQFTIQNSAGVDVQMVELELSCDGGTSTAIDADWENSSLTLNGQTIDVNFTNTELGTAGCTQPISEGDKFSATYDIVYRKSGETVTHTGSGSIQARVEA